MATIMEKDVLLEYVSCGYLIKQNDEKSLKDLELLAQIYKDIIKTDYEDIDYEKTLAKISAIRSKYEL